MKILQIIVQEKLRSGGAVQLAHLARGLAGRGHNVHAVFNDNPRFRDDFHIFEGSGVELRFMPMNRLQPKVKSIRTVLRLRNYIRDEAFDIIHAHKGNAVDLVWTATLGMNIPIITNRGVNIPLGYFQSWKYRTTKIRGIVAVARAVKDVMVETGKIDPGKIHVIYGSVDIERFQPKIVSTVRAEFGIPEERIVIGFVGNPNPRKGLQDLLPPFSSLVHAGRDIHLLLAGVSEKDVDVYDLHSETRKRVTAMGFRHDVPNCMAAFDIFVFPGVKDEGLTGTVREAAAMGLPIVTTNVAGNGELIQSGVNGLLVPIGDRPAIEKAIKTLLEYPELATGYGRAAREFVVQEMSIDIRTRRVEELYQSILNTGKGR